MKNPAVFYKPVPREALPSPGEVEEMAAVYGWFAPYRTVREMVTGGRDALAEIMAPWRGESALRAEAADLEILSKISTDEVIDRFLNEKDLRIVAEDGDPDTDIRTEPVLDEEDELVSEQLAEIYLSQGFREQAVAIYSKLSLRNPEKSVYFAELISKIKK